MRKRIPFLFFLFFYLLFSFLTFRDFGVTWDEPDTYREGNRLYQFLIHGAPLSYLDPEHGYPYSFFLAFLTGPENYELLHLLNLVFAAVLFGVFYELLLAEFKDPWGALAGPVFLFFSPSFLGSIPGNPKDVPFAVFYLLSLSLLYLYPRRFPELKFGWFFFGLLAGISISARIVGFTLFPLLVLNDWYLFLGDRRGRTPGSWLRSRIPYWTGSFLVSQAVCAILWPFIGMDYFHNLPVVLWLSVHFPPKFQFLFNGQMTDASAYPWYCLPLGLAVTTPLFILLFLAVFFFRWKGRGNGHLAFLMGTALLLDLGFALVLRPAFYDGIRHFIFLIPLISILASIGFLGLLRDRGWGLGRAPVLVPALAGILAVAVDVVRLHPYQYAYFNELVGGVRGAYGRFETDYWVASFKEAVDWLKKNELKDPARVYKVCAYGHPPQYRIYFTPQMRFVEDPSGADYVLLMNRNGIRPGPGDGPRVLYRVEREGAPFCFVLRGR